MSVISWILQHKDDKTQEIREKGSRSSPMSQAPAKGEVSGATQSSETLQDGPLHTGLLQRLPTQSHTLKEGGKI